LRATGATVDEIALRTGLSAPTIRKYYLRELEAGQELVRAVLIEAIFKAALDGRVGSQRLALELLDQGQAAVPIAKAAPVSDRQAKDEPLGKKAQADADAVVAHEGTEWASLLRH